MNRTIHPDLVVGQANDFLVVRLELTLVEVASMLKSQDRAVSDSIKSLITPLMMEGDEFEYKDQSYVVKSLKKVFIPDINKIGMEFTYSLIQ